MNVTTDLVGRIWAYETDKLRPEEVVNLFRDLTASGEIWQLPSQYLDNASEMIRRGYFDKRGAN